MCVSIQNSVCNCMHYVEDDFRMFTFLREQHTVRKNRLVSGLRICGKIEKNTIENSPAAMDFGSGTPSSA